jgi:hypothetical protein
MILDAKTAKNKKPESGGGTNPGYWEVLVRLDGDSRQECDISKSSKRVVNC